MVNPLWLKSEECIANFPVEGSQRERIIQKESMNTRLKNGDEICCVGGWVVKSTVLRNEDGSEEKWNN